MTRPAKRELAWLWAPVFLCYLAFLLLVAFYHISTGDEGAHLYAIRQLADGLMPVRDFFSFYALGYSGPYALFITALSPHIEAVRLFSALATLATAVMLVTRLRDGYPSWVALCGLILLIGNELYFSTYYQVRHAVPSTLGLFTAFFLLTGRGPISGGRALLAGAFTGLAINARIPLLVPCLFLLYMALREAWPAQGEAASPRAWSPLLGRFCWFFIGGTIVSLPTLYLLFTDFERLYFDFLGFRLDWSTSLSG